MKCWNPPSLHWSLSVGTGSAVRVLVGRGVAVVVAVAVAVAVQVGVAVPVAVGVLVGTGVFVTVLVGVLVGVCVTVLVGVLVGAGVAVAVPVGVAVGVLVAVRVGVAVPVGVLVGVWVGVLVRVLVGVAVAVAVLVGVLVRVSVFAGVFVGVAVRVVVPVAVGVGVELTCWARVIWPLSETVWPGSMLTSFTEKLKEPNPQVVWPAEGGWASGLGSQLGSLNVKRIGVLLKSTSTPPVLSERTVPVIVAVKVVLLEPLMPCGAVKVTCKVKGVLYDCGAVLSESEPRLLKLDPGLGLPPSARIPFAVVPEKVALE